MEKVKIGTVIDAFGLDGTLKIVSSSSFIDERCKPGSLITLEKEDESDSNTLTIISYRTNGDILFLKTKEITTKEEALAKKRYILIGEKNESLLRKGEYYYSDLETCFVYDENKNLLGKVKCVEEFPSAITLRVSRDNNKDFFVPFISEFIKKVDIKNKQIIINVIEGMLWKK